MTKVREVSPQPNRPLVVAVDDEPDNLELLERALGRRYEVLTFSDPREAARQLRELPHIDAVVFDQRMPHVRGTDLLHMLNETRDDAESIVKVILSAYTEVEDMIASINRGRVDYYCVKPFRPDDLRSTLARLLALKRHERRSHARAVVPNFADARINGEPAGRDRIENLSSAGFFLKTRHPYEVGDFLNVELSLPGNEQLSLRGRVVRLDAENAGVGVMLVASGEAAQRSVDDLVVAHLLTDDIHKLEAKYPFINVDELVLFTREDRIREFFTEALAKCRNFVLSTAHRTNTYPISFSRADESEHKLVGRTEAPSSALHVGESLLVSSYEDGCTYSFETSVLHRDGQDLSLVYPRVIFYSDKRHSDRVSLTDQSRQIEIPLSHRPGQFVCGSVINQTEDGLAFVTRDDIGLATVGTPVPQLRVTEGDSVIWEGFAEIRNVSEDNLGRGLRIGLQLGLERQSVRRRDASGLQIRSVDDNAPAASGVALAEKERPLVQVVRFQNLEGQDMVGILNLVEPKDPVPIPCVILPPAWGKTKETLFALACTLEQEMRGLHQPIAILRYDGVRRRGESFHDDEAKDPKYQALHATLRQGAADIAGAVAYLDNNPYFRAGPVFLVTFSLSSLEARLALRDAGLLSRVTAWIACMGAPELRHLLTRVGGNFDIVEAHQLGQRFGPIDFLGVHCNADTFLGTAIEDRLIDLDAARRDFAATDIPISWICGEHDAWVDAAQVNEVMSVGAKARREVMSISIGHNARTSMEAMALFATVTQTVKEHLGLGEGVALPPLELLTRVQIAERERRPPKPPLDAPSYWESYLFGTNDQLNYDVLSYSDDYIDFVQAHVDELCLQGGERILELGSGTGNIPLAIIRNQKVVKPAEMVVTDLVPKALEHIQAKVRGLNEAPAFDLTYLPVSLELNRYNAVASFLAGETYAFRALHGQIEGLSYETAHTIDAKLDPWLHDILRGRTINSDDVARLRKLLDWDVADVVVELNRAAQTVSGQAEPSETKRLVFSPDAHTNCALPFEDASFDCVVASLVLPYIFNPLLSLREVYRILRPGGRLVLSTMIPDADTSGIFTRLIGKLSDGRGVADAAEQELALESARAFLNRAAELFDLEEQGTFSFFAKSELESLIRQAGFSTVDLREAFGSPPQATLARAIKPAEPIGRPG